ncbi:MAG TPA: SDR family NAD(P)-dependent oxidoreductase, partial [Pseudomonadales bacterium]|nr:SDR family NAD(P)-dependent oxidoreductase [Pseudomonadales bacterium]
GRQLEVTGVVTNTMHKASISAAFDKAIEAYGKVHILCNNAGVGTIGSNAGIWEVPEKDWTWVMGVNFYGVLYGVQVAVPHMLGHGEPSHIVNTASLAGLLPSGGAYGVSKHAVLALTEGLYRDLKNRNANIGASVLCPGFVSTNIYAAERNRPADLASSRDADPLAVQMTKAVLEQGKAPDEIADIVFNSIEEDRLYILPHPAWDSTVLSRVEHILARGGMMTIDPDEMAKRRNDGEIF